MIVIFVHQEYKTEVYLALVCSSHMIKIKYVDGHIIAMVFAFQRHNLIGFNIAQEISLHKKGRPFVVCANDMTIKEKK